MRILGPLALLGLISSSAWASTNLIFSKDGDRATVSMAAMGNNPDAVALFSVLTVAPTKFGGRLAKRVDFVDDSGVKALNVSCVVSETYKNEGNCVLTLYRSANVELNPAKASAFLSVQGAEANRLAQDFEVGGGTEIFRSADQHLVIRAGEEFRIEYLP